MSDTDDPGMKNEVEVYEEICCEMCNVIAHNHFECPNCDAYRPGTSIYHEIRLGDEFECQRCGMEYEILSFCGRRNSATATIKQLTRYSDCPDCGNEIEWREGRESVVCMECFNTQDTAELDTDRD